VGLLAALGAGPVALDTLVFIYYIENHPRYASVLDELFGELDAGRLEAVTSAITLLEVLVLPYRHNNGLLAARYEAFLTRSRGLHLMEIDRPLLRSAARLRATHMLRTPDALQLAAALSARCSAFVTNDRRLPRLRALKIIQLTEHSGAGSS
jgi:predicted nucleic acid-binding protein